jgi:hypothetical protein
LVVLRSRWLVCTRVHCDRRIYNNSQKISDRFFINSKICLLITRQSSIAKKPLTRSLPDCWRSKSSARKNRRRVHKNYHSRGARKGKLRGACNYCITQRAIPRRARLFSNFLIWFRKWQVLQQCYHRYTL